MVISLTKGSTAVLKVKMNQLLMVRMVRNLFFSNNCFLSGSKSFSKYDTQYINRMKPLTSAHTGTGRRLLSKTNGQFAMSIKNMQGKRRERDKMERGRE